MLIAMFAALLHHLQVNLSTTLDHPHTSANQPHSTFFRSNGIMLSTVFVSAFAIQMYVQGSGTGRNWTTGLTCHRAFDQSSEKIWDSINRGRQWKDIKAKYVQAAEEEE